MVAPAETEVHQILTSPSQATSLVSCHVGGHRPGVGVGVGENVGAGVIVGEGVGVGVMVGECVGVIVGAGLESDGPTTGKTQNVRGKLSREPDPESFSVEHCMCHTQRKRAKYFP